MEIIRTVLDVISSVLSVFLTGMLIYQLIVTVFGFTRKTKDYKDHDPQSRFLVLVPAHNEEKVIAGIVENLQHMEYPKDLYDFYIIADNCDDRTADVARQMGAKVIETRKESPDSPTGKPIALRKALESLGNYQDHYDLLMIFDADNLMDPNMFLEVNSQYLDKGRPEIIQCYLGAKNKKGFVPWFYYTSYTNTNRFFQLAKHRMGCNCAVGGTGFAMDTQYLHKRGGWTTMSLTEDFEIQVESTLEGGRVLWNHNVRVYDEKPTSMRASIRQRTRWAQGHFYVCFRNTGKVLSAMVHRRISLKEGISTLTYMYSLATYLAATVQLVIGGIEMVLDCLMGAPLPPLLPLLGSSLAGFALSVMPLIYIADYVDNHIPFKLKTLPYTFASFAVCMIVATVSQWKGLFLWKKQNQWVKTEHSIDHLEGYGENLPGKQVALTAPEEENIQA